jgi:D-alanyl-D-alanine carboxypeptidase
VPFARRLFLIFSVLVLVTAPVTAVDAAQHRSHSHPAHSTAKPKPAAKTASLVAPSVETPELLVDMQTGDTLYSEAAGKPWHPASLTKLMTAYVAFQAIAEGRFSLDSRVTLSVKAVSQAPASSGLPAGDSLTLKDALYIMLVKSANDMAWAVAETLGNGDVNATVAEMNATAARLGLTGTHYNNPNGLPDDGQVTTARDLAVLAIDLRRTFPQYDDIFRTQSVTIGKVTLRASNLMLKKFAGMTGMKTGYICGSGLNIVATAKRDGRELMAVVLGGTSERERDQIAAHLLLRGFAKEFPDSGSSVVNIANDVGAPPMDMKPLLCGKYAKAYVQARLKQYPMGLKGQPNYLTDKVVGASYAAVDFGVPGKAPVIATPTDDPMAEGDSDPSQDSATAAAPATAGPVPKPRPAGR